MPKPTKKGARGRVKINPKGLLRGVAKRKREREKAMRELFGPHQPPGKRD